MIKDVGQKKIPSLGVPIENSDPNLTASNILSGKKIFGVTGTSVQKVFSSGSGTSNASRQASVSGLSFTPTLIIVEAMGTSGASCRQVYMDGSAYSGALTAINSVEYKNTGTCVTGQSWTVSGGSFTVLIDLASTSFNWWAWG